MLKSMALGVLTVVIGPWIGLVLSLLVGLIIDPLAQKHLAESALRRFRYVWGFAWIGFAIGMMNASSIYFFEVNGIVLLLIFLFYLVFFMKHKTQSAFYDFCNGDSNQFKRLTRSVEIATFLSYLMGLYGLWTIFQKWSK